MAAKRPAAPKHSDAWLALRHRVEQLSAREIDLEKLNGVLVPEN
jgi:hypothetical protein